MRLADSRLKIERANKHIADIETRILGLRDSQFSIVEINANGGESLKYDFRDTDAFTGIALILGDALHNLQSALDYAWIQTGQAVPFAIDKYSRFPIRDTVNDIEGALKGRKIDTISRELFRIIVSDIKPYNGGDFAIWSLHELNILDKHQLLIPVFANASILDIEVEDEVGESTRGNTFAITQQPPYYVDFEPGLHIKNNGKLSFQILVKEEATGYYIHIPETIYAYSQRVLGVMEILERFLQTIQS